LLQNIAEFNFTSVHRLPLDCLLEETIAGLYMGSEIFRDLMLWWFPWHCFNQRCHNSCDIWYIMTIQWRAVYQD